MTPVCETQTNLIFDVLIPAELKLTEKQLQAEIDRLVLEMNPTFKCVITFDYDFTGK